MEKDSEKLFSKDLLLLLVLCTCQPRCFRANKAFSGNKDNLWEDTSLTEVLKMFIYIPNRAFMWYLV